MDRLLGCVLSYADDTFDQALMIGFASAIKKEYAWRVKRGESLANLQAFGRLTGDDDRGRTAVRRPAAHLRLAVAAGDPASGHADSQVAPRRIRT